MVKRIRDWGMFVLMFWVGKFKDIVIILGKLSYEENEMVVKVFFIFVRLLGWWFNKVNNVVNRLFLIYVLILNFSLVMRKRGYK